MTITVQQIVFIIISAVTLISGWIVVTDRNLFHAAIALMASFAGVAGLYILLDAGFLAASQLLVYIGAISILVIFAIMMTRRLMQTTESPYNSQWRWGILGALVAFVLLAVLIYQTWPVDQFAEPAAISAVDMRASVERLGISLVSIEQYVLPFEIASVLLLAALVGAIVIARPEDES
ncbi:MAG: NADH-quinone oxidoreductase subunit J [Candidatus Promineifilaceae bacterium]|jgi:NADH:ubiquinone oxidoreductase subunit 6 (subunit J)